jgi:hypothetical protein
MSDAGSEVDLEREDWVFTLEEEGNIDVQSVFLKDMLSERDLGTEVVEGQEKPSEPFIKVLGGGIETYMADW